MNVLMKSNTNKIIRLIDIKKLEENIPEYILWLKKNKRVDRIDTYKEFLQV